MDQGLRAELLGSRTIRTAGGDFVVRGLNAEAIFAIVGRHREALSALFDRLVVQGEGGPQISLDQTETLVVALVDAVPEIVGLIIAAAAGPMTDEAIAIARALPAPVQMAALEAVAELTFTSEMPPKKVLEIVVKAMGGVTSALEGLAA